MNERWNTNDFKCQLDKISCLSPMYFSDCGGRRNAVSWRWQQLSACVCGSSYYLQYFIRWTTIIPGRFHFRSATSMMLTFPRTRLPAIGDSDFPVAAACIWNRLPPNVTFAVRLCLMCPCFKISDSVS